MLGRLLSRPREDLRLDCRESIELGVFAPLERAPEESERGFGQC